jgi:hypothetical protein
LTGLDIDGHGPIEDNKVRQNQYPEVEPCPSQSDLLGSDHYQVMTANGIIRFWTLTSCLLCFLEEQRATALEPGLTCGDIRRRIQEEYRRNLLYWLQAQFQVGRTVDDIGIQLAISSS